MSLTQPDLQKIKKLVRLEIDDALEQKLEEKLEQKFDEKLKPIHQKLDSMEKNLTKRIDSVQKSLDTTIKYFDTVTTDRERRLKHVEKKVNAFPLIAAN